MRRGIAEVHAAPATECHHAWSAENHGCKQQAQCADGEVEVAANDSDAVNACLKGGCEVGGGC
jgi:hypothetical protein